MVDLKKAACTKVAQAKEVSGTIKAKLVSAEDDLRETYAVITQRSGKDEGGSGEKKRPAEQLSFDLESIRSRLREHLVVVKEVQEGQESSIQEISRLSLKSASAYDSLLSGKESVEKETILSYGELLKDGLKKVAALTQLLNETLKEASDVKAHLQANRPKIEALQESLKTLGDTSRSLGSTYQNSCNEANSMLDELIELSSFYSNFLTAHESIPQEIGKCLKAA